jgi:hypothetical protein
VVQDPFVLGQAAKIRRKGTRRAGIVGFGKLGVASRRREGLRHVEGLLNCWAAVEALWDRSKTGNGDRLQMMENWSLPLSALIHYCLSSPVGPDVGSARHVCR